MKNLWNILLTVTLATPCFGQTKSPEGPNLYGGDSGGGGYGFLLQDNTVVVGDPWAKSMNGALGTPDQLKPEVINGILQADYLLTSYTIFGKGVKWYTHKKNGFGVLFSPFDKFLKYEVLSKDIEYRFVDPKDIPPIENCEKIPDFADEPENATTLRYGCTHLKMTWMNREAIEKMNLRELTKAIFHERMMGLNLPQYPYVVKRNYVHEVVTGLGVLMEHHNQQQSGAHTALTDKEVQQLLSMRNALIKLGMDIDLNKYQDYKFNPPINANLVVHRNGGALVHPQAQIDPTAFLDVSARIEHSETVIEANAEIFNLRDWMGSSTIDGPIVVREGAKIANLNIGGFFGDIVIEKGVVLENFKDTFYHEYTFFNKVKPGILIFEENVSERICGDGRSLDFEGTVRVNSKTLPEIRKKMCKR